MAERRKTAGRKREVVEMMFTGADRTSLITNRMKQLYEDGRPESKEEQSEAASPEGKAAETVQTQMERTPQESVRVVRTVKRTSERVQRVKEVREKRRTRVDASRSRFAYATETGNVASADLRMKVNAINEAKQKAAQQTGNAVIKKSKRVLERAKNVANTSAKAIYTGVKSGIALIAASGGTALLVILVICMAAMIFGSAFGIFFTETGQGERTIRTVMYELDTEYEQTIAGIRGSQEHDVLEQQGTRPEWRDVLAVYAVKTNLDPNDPQELITMTNRKEQKLRDIYWDMCSIGSTVETGWRIVTITVVGKDGKETEKKVLRGVTILTIRTDSLAAEQMAGRYFFDWEQRELLKELLDRGNDLFWEGIIP